MSNILITLLKASDDNVLPRKPEQVGRWSLADIEIMLKTPVQMSLLQLPLEALHMIVEYLDQPALNALCRTCRTARRCSKPALFKFNVKQKGVSGLFWAVVHNRPDIATSFLDDYGADINGELFIFHVIRHWPAETAEHFLKYPQIDVNPCAQSEENLLWFVVHHQHLSIFEELLSHPEIDLTPRDRDDHTVLSVAIWQGNMSLSLFQLLLANQQVPDRITAAAQTGNRPSSNLDYGRT